MTPREGETLLAGDGLPRAAPTTKGVDPRGVSAFLDAAAATPLELHGFMLYRRGAVVAEGWWAPYRADRPHMLHSLVKSVTGTGVGLALDAGLLSLDDRVVDFFTEELPRPVDERLAAMTVRHLLTMATGHRTGLSGGEWRRITTSWVREFFKEPLVEPPGQRFIYSSATSYMLSAIVQKVTGQTLHDYMTPRLFEPLGLGPMAWDKCPNGINTGGNGISCTTADLIKFGALHLNGGVWNGRRLLSADWIAMATRPSFTNVSLGVFDGRRYRPATKDDPPSAQHIREGYGYQWWTGPGGAYYAAGLFGQYAYVLPQQQAVIALTAAVGSSHHRLPELIWRHLVPAMTDTVPADAAGAERAVATRLAGLQLLPTAPYRDSPRAATISGRVFRMAPNEDQVSAVSLTFADGRCSVAIEDHRGRHTVVAGLGTPIESDTTVTGNRLHHEYQPDRMRVVASGTWDDPDSFRMTWTFVETAFRDTVVCRFGDGTMTLDRSVNVNSSATDRPTLTGRA